MGVCQSASLFAIGASDDLAPPWCQWLARLWALSTHTWVSPVIMQPNCTQLGSPSSLYSMKYFTLAGVWVFGSNRALLPLWSTRVAPAVRLPVTPETCIGQQQTLAWSGIGLGGLRFMARVALLACVGGLTLHCACVPLVVSCSSSCLLMHS